MDRPSYRDTIMHLTSNVVVQTCIWIDDEDDDDDDDHDDDDEYGDEKDDDKNIDGCGSEK